MKLASFAHEGRTRVGVVVGDEVADVAAADASLPGSVVELLAAAPAALAGAAAAAGRAPRLPLASVRLLAPVPRPPEFLAIGLNYADHVREAGLETPTFPVFFNKQTACVAGPYDAIHLPRVSNKLDYEGELGFVIGRRCRHVPASRAREVIAGYLVVNDVSVRDWQFKSPTWTLGKSFDTHGPMGPWLTTADDVPDPHALGIRTWVNGEERQNSNTREFIFSCWSMVETLSTVFTLEPGLVVSTGTPAGVGGPRRIYLRAGDVVRVEIDGLGAIENRVVPEPEAAAW